MNSNLRILLPVIKPPRLIFGAHGRTYSNDVKEIKIPKRIHRGPTDILKALSSTVGIDSTAAHYKFHDDPYLMPYSNPSKRMYALSQEAGRKAAQWIRQEHAELFQHKVADPIVEKFIPQMVFNDESNVNEDTVKSLIGKQQVTDVITVYQILKKRGQDLSVDTKQQMLELLCFYNCDEPTSDQWLEEKWFKHDSLRSRGELVAKKTWKDDGFAEKIYDELIQGGGDASKANCALITGMLSYGQIDRAWKLFEECKQNGIALNSEVYNAVLEKTAFLRESHEMVWQLVTNLLSEMHSAQIRPTLDTLNSLLSTLERLSRNRFSRENSLSVIAEFKQLGIEPSLQSYGHLIRIFQKDKRQLAGLIREVCELLEGNPEATTVRAKEDNTFFTRAMEAINNQLNDKELAVRLDNILHKVSDYTLIGNSFGESLYYRHYFLVSLNNEEIDEFMQFYHTFVPNIYVPEPMIMLELLNAIELQMGWKHLPKIWGDIILFDQVNRINLVEKLLSTAAQAVVEDAEQLTNMADLGWSIWEKIQSGTVRNFEWTGAMLGDVLHVLAGGKELGKAHIVMDHIDRHKDSTAGEPGPASLDKYVDACLESGTVDGAMRCAKYCRSREIIETENILKKIVDSGIKLDGPQERLLSELQQKM